MGSKELILEQKEMSKVGATEDFRIHAPSNCWEKGCACSTWAENAKQISIFGVWIYTLPPAVRMLHGFSHTWSFTVLILTNPVELHGISL